MTTVQTEVAATTYALRRRLARVFAVGALAAGAVAALAAPAHAAVTSAFHVAGAGVPVVADPNATQAAPIATLARGTRVTIDCGVRGRRVHRDSVWHHITSPVTGYIADYYTDTPGFDRFIRGEAVCPAATRIPAPTAAPVSAAPVATRGATIDYNEGYRGSCVYYAMIRFHQFTGVYPRAFGDAKYLAGSAAANGWTVGRMPRVNSLAVFQPGQNGAGGPTGHVAWVERVDGDRISIAEMNAPDPWVVSHRWLTPAAGVRYIYAP